mgnify:FL=1
MSTVIRGQTMPHAAGLSAEPENVSAREAALVERAIGWQAELAARADEIEANRALPADIARRFAEDGFYRLLVPRALGGLETAPQTYVDVVRQLARADAAAAWCVMIGATSGLVSAYLPEQTARSVFTDPNVLLAGVFAPRGKAASESRDVAPTVLDRH